MGSARVERANSGIAERSERPFLVKYGERMETENHILEPDSFPLAYDPFIFLLEVAVLGFAPSHSFEEPGLWAPSGCLLRLHTAMKVIFN